MGFKNGRNADTIVLFCSYPKTPRLRRFDRAEVFCLCLILLFSLELTIPKFFCSIIMIFTAPRNVCWSSYCFYAPQIRRYWVIRSPYNSHGFKYKSCAPPINSINNIHKISAQVLLVASAWIDIDTDASSVGFNHTNIIFFVLWTKPDLYF